LSKFIFVTGGVVSGLGKGVAAASIGTLLKYQGLKVNLIKLDPYINVDPGTMSPFQHGEVFVTEDGTETDLDLGHYERFVDKKMGRNNNFTTGKIYENVIKKERRGDYMGQTVQVVPHIIQEIQKSIELESDDYDITIVEIGGVVGDIESLPFLECIRQMGIEKEPEEVLYIHLTLIPYLDCSGEMKTKPTQHSVKELRSIGIQPDILICRSESFLREEERKKIALHTNVRADSVISAVDVDNIYRVPLVFNEQGLDGLILKALQLPSRFGDDLKEWKHMINLLDNPTDGVTIALVGKYSGLKDSYKSISEALIHAGIHTQTNVHVEYIRMEEITHCQDILKLADGILVPGGFGERGMADKGIAIQYARENGIPFLGICLGMQLAVVEFARNVLALEHADSAEADPQTPDPVITLITEWIDEEGHEHIRNVDSQLGGSLRLGGQSCHLLPGSMIYDMYGRSHIVERHRHRYELNNDYRQALEIAGLKVTGTSHEDNLVEVMELEGHPWFLGIQFHPEFSSNPRRGHPIFLSYIRAARRHRETHNS